MENNKEHEVKLPRVQSDETRKNKKVIRVLYPIKEEDSDVKIDK
jgi:hypothetical protein